MFKGKGYTLVELMTTIAVVGVVMVGVTATFSKITQSANNATKSADLTNTTRGLSDIIGKDFANAGRGFSDLKALNIKFNFHKDFFEWGDDDTPDPYMYSIPDVAYDSTTGFSDITFHWFEYDVKESPTFFFHTDEAWGNGVLDTYTQGYFVTNEVDALENIEPGDIFLIYKMELLVEPLSQEQLEAFPIWYYGTKDEEVINEAIILQVDSVSNIGNNAVSQSMGLDQDAQITFSDGPIFSNKLAEPLVTKYTAMSETIMGSIERKSSYTMNGNVWRARKLGDASSFNRVIYSVDLGETVGAKAALTRNHNGEVELLATDVQAFVIDLGLDVSPGTSMDTMTGSDTNGLVSLTDEGAWTRGYDTDVRWGAMEEDVYKVAVGRYALQALVRYTQQGDVDKSEGKDSYGEDYKKQRSFVRQYRIRNNGIPIQSQ